MSLGLFGTITRSHHAMAKLAADTEQGDFVESLLPVANSQIAPKRATKVVAWTVFYLLCSSSM